MLKCGCDPHVEWCPLCRAEKHRQEAESPMGKVKARVAELESTNAFLRSTLHRCIAHAGMPDPANGCRAIIATAKDALAIP